MTYWNGHLIWTNDRDYEPSKIAKIRYTTVDDGDVKDLVQGHSALFDIGVFVNNTNGRLNC